MGKNVARLVGGMTDIHKGPGSVPSTTQTGHSDTKEVEAGGSEDLIWLPQKFEAILSYICELVVVQNHLPTCLRSAFGHDLRDCLGRTNLRRKTQFTLGSTILWVSVLGSIRVEKMSGVLGTHDSPSLTLGV